LLLQLRPTYTKILRELISGHLSYLARRNKSGQVLAFETALLVWWPVKAFSKGCIQYKKVQKMAFFSHAGVGEFICLACSQAIHQQRSCKQRGRRAQSICHQLGAAAVQGERRSSAHAAPMLNVQVLSVLQGVADKIVVYECRLL
jgi:hypothetical protein